MGKCKGSITVFSLLALLLVTATLCSLLEGTRYLEINRLAELQTEIALESVFANYNTYLWKNYRLLGTEKESAKEILKKAADGRKDGTGANLLAFQVHTGDMEEYTLLTDGDGSVFIKSVSTYMKENILYETAKGVYNQYEAIKSLLDESGMNLSNIDEALKEIEAIPAKEVGTSVGTSARNSEKSESVLSILQEAKKWKENGLMKLFLKDTSKLSDAELDDNNDIFSRELAIGQASAEEDVSWMERILLQQYLLTYLSSFEEEKAGRVLSYEVEYLIGQKSNDKDNLMAVITRILAIREAANFLYLLSDPLKIQQAETLALALGGSMLNPIVVEAIRLGIVTAWAMGESILDVRALLAGKKVPLLKSSETWTLELENIEIVSQQFHTAKESKWGLSYENYLGILLLFETDKRLAMRTMNLQEATIRKASGNADFGMDSLLVWAEAKISYDYVPVFPFLRVIDAEERWEYKIWTKKNYGYY